jgi:Ca2+-binding RTX toxin-like protein
MSTINGTESGETLHGTIDNDLINGNGGDDTLYGGEGADTLDGGTGLDKLYGEGGDDVLKLANPPQGGEIYNGGDGFDTLHVFGSATTNIVTTGGGYLASNINLPLGVTLTSIEAIRFDSSESLGTALRISLAQASSLTHVEGGSGYDQLNISVAGLPSGTYTLPSLVKVNWNESTDVFATGDIVRLFAGGSNNYTLNASAGHTGVEFLFGGDGNDTLNGTDGVEILNGGYGVNVLNAGGGNDLLQSTHFNASPFTIGSGSFFDGGAGFDYLQFTGSQHFQGNVAGIEGIVLSKLGPTAEDPEVEVSSNILLGMASNLHLRGSGSFEIHLENGHNFDGSAWVHEAGSNVGVEVFGGPGNSSYIGTSGNDRFSGGFGTSTMTGGAGSDQFEAGNGHHTVLDFTVGVDKVDVQDLNITSFAQVLPLLSQVGNDVVLSRLYNGVQQTMTLKNVSLASLDESSFAFQIDHENDTRIGTDNADHLIGAFGNDNLQGLGGNDILYASKGDDTLLGGSGDDHLTGGEGNDSIDGGDGVDTASYAEATGPVTVSLAAGTASGADGNDTLTGIENLLGSAHGDHLTGDAGANFIDGGAGNDTMIGGAGNDIYVINPGDAIFEDAGGGIDEMRVSDNFGLMGNVENLTALGTGNLFLGGNELDNVITGNSGDNFLVGNGGNDTLTGGAGFDQAAFFLPGTTPGTLRVVDGANGKLLVQLVQSDGSFENVFEVTPLGDGSATVTGLNSMAYQGTDTVSSAEQLSFFIDVYPQPHGPGQIANINIAVTAPPVQDDFAHVNGSVGADVIDLTQLYPSAGPQVDLNVFAGRGDDTIIGSSGDNYMDGEQGSDTIDGGAGSDAVAFRLPADTLGTLQIVDNNNGTLSVRLVQANGSFENIFLVTPGSTGSATVQALGSMAHYGTDTVTNVEHLSFVIDTWPTPPTQNLGIQLSIYHNGSYIGGSAASDTINLADYPGANNVNAGSGNDVVTGTSLNDYLVGEGGNDTLNGAGGRDTAGYRLPAGTTGTLRVIEGSAGRATVELVQADGSSEIVFEITGSGSGSATITGVGRMAHLGTDTVSGIEEVHIYVDSYPNPTPPGQFVNVLLAAVQFGDASSQVQGSINSETIDIATFGTATNARGGNGDDLIIGTSAQNFIAGDRGNDTIIGNGGNDQVQFFLPSTSTGKPTLVKNADGTFAVWRVVDNVQVEQLFHISELNGTITITGLNSAAHFGTDTVSGVGHIGIFPEGPFDQNRSLFFSVAAGQNGAQDFGGIFADVLDFSGRAAGVNFFGDYGDDQVVGSAFADVINGGLDNDTLSGAGGNDTLRGQGGSDVLEGGEGDDLLIGGFNTSFGAQPGDGADVLRGGAGNDILRGGDGDDTLEGGSGNDNLRGDAGGDHLDGGEGTDFVSYFYSALTTGATLDFRGVDITNGSFADPLGGTDTLLNFERLGVGGSNFDDIIYGAESGTDSDGGFANQLGGGGGNDQVHGSSRKDHIRGDAGTDVLTGGQGEDLFVGTLEQWHGDQITDLEYGEEILIEGVALAASQVQLATAADGSRELRIDGNNDGTFETIIKIPNLSGQINIEAGGTTAANSFSYISITPAPAVIDPPVIAAPPALSASDSLTISGTAGAGLVVSLYDGSTLLGQATAAANGSWSIEVDGLDEGAHSLTAVASDGAGNSSAPSAAVSVTVDTIAPSAPVLDALPAVTNDSTPQVSGSAEPGSTVRILQGATVLAETVAAANGSWSVSLAAALADGSYSFAVVAVDAAGNASAAAPLTLAVDTAAPEAPTINAGPSLTNQDSLLLSGTAVPGSLVSIFDNGVLAIQVTAGTDGNWSVTLDGLEGGAHSLVARVSDEAGNSASSAARSVSVDLTAPDSPIVESEGATTDSTPEISGIAEPGATITILAGSTVVGTGIAGGDGSWSVTLATPLADGSHDLLVVATDAAGNASPAEPFTLAVSGTAPAAPSITTSGGVSATSDLVLGGTAAAGVTIEILRGSSVVATTVADGSGAWSVEVEGVEGANSFTAVAIDADGDRSIASAPVSITVDTFAPEAPVVTSGELFNTGLVLLTGTAEAGSTVTLAKGSIVLATVTANASGQWTYTASAGQLAEGANALTATARDAAGNVSEASDFTVTVDTLAPAAPVIAAPGAGGYIDTDVTLTGTAEPGATILVYDGATLVGESIAEADGSWSLVLADLAEGQHVFTAVAIDEAGNASAASAAQTVIADASPPLVTLVSAILREDNGASATDNISNTGGITLTGTAEPGSVLTFFGGPDGTTPLDGNLVVGAGGLWSFTTTLPEGQHKLVVTATDSAGNSASTLPSTQTFVIDKTAPVVTMTASLARDSATAGDNITNDGRINISGTGEAGTTVFVYDVANGGSVLVGSALVAADGSWSLAQLTLSPGTHQLVARAADVAGNQGSSAPSALITVDTSTAITMTQTLAGDTGASSSDGVTRNGGVTLSGTAEVGATIVIKDGNTTLSSLTVGSSGTWSFTTSLSDGSHQLSATATDRAGNTASATGSTIVVDRAAPAAPTLSVSADTPIVSGATRDTTLTLSGSAEANSRLSIYDGAVLIGTVTVANNGQWSFTTAALADGAHSFTARAEDLAGNISPSSAVSVITIDTVPPPTPAISSISTDTGRSSTDRVTSDTTLTVQGTGQPGATISIYEGAELLGTGTVAANGSWAVAISKQLSEGVHNLTATASDRVGNASAPTAAFVVTIDKTAPTGTAINTILTDTGAAPSVATGGVTRDATLRLSGTAEALVMVQVFAGTVFLGEVQASATGEWSFDYAVPADGLYSFTAKAVDLAGNEHVSRSYAVTVDTSAPVPVITGAVSSKSSTTISGTAEAGTVVQVFEGDLLLGTATASKSGTWKITATLLSDTSTHTLRAVGTDGAGNVGNSPGVTIMGTSRADVLTGGTGNDVLLGYGGNDRLDGGTGGNDRLTGGVGNDTFVFQQSFGTDTVTDYQDGFDKLDLDSGLTFNQLVITAVDADGDGAMDDVSITVGNSTILLLNVNVGSLTADDFLF